MSTKKTRQVEPSENETVAVAMLRETRDKSLTLLPNGEAELVRRQRAAVDTTGRLSYNAPIRLLDALNKLQAQ